LIKVLILMGRNKQILLPSLQRLLAEVGENIHLARLRRKLSAEMLAERAGITRNTLRAIENGEASVAFGSYATVLLCLGLEKDLKFIAHDDELGRKLQDLGLTIKARAPKNSKIDPGKKLHD
jgi:transcriptional regulator with XRE-family HTH domain